MFIVINGGGKVASALAEKLGKRNHTVTVIERRQEVADKLASEVYGLPVTVFVGDGCDADQLEEAGIDRADIFVAATGEDDDNLISCQLAKVSYGVPRAISRINSPKNLKIFRQLGIEGISSTEIISRMIEEEAIIPNMHTLKTLREGNLELLEVVLDADLCPINGRLVRDLKLPRDVRLIAVLRTGHEIESADGPDLEVVTLDTVLNCGDTVIVVANPKREEEISRILAGDLEGSR